MFLAKIKKAILILSVAIFAIFSIPLLDTAVAYAAPVASWDDGDVDSKAKAWVYYKALRTCLALGIMKNSFSAGSPGATAKTMSKLDAVNLEWFNNSRLLGADGQNEVIVGSLIYPRSANRGGVNCGSDDGKKWIGEMLAIFGYTSGPKFLCDIGFTRKIANPDSTACATVDSGPGENDFKVDSDINTRVKNLDAVFKGMFGSTTPGDFNSLPGSLKYVIYRNTFLEGGCGQVSSTTKGVAGSKDTKGFLYGIDDMDGKDPVKYLYSQIDSDIGPGTSIPTYAIYNALTANPNILNQLPDKATSDLKITCKDLADKANSFFKDYKRDVEDGKINPGGTNPPGTTDDGTTQCVVPNIGWIVCGLMNAMGGLNDVMYDWVKSTLILNPLQTKDDNGKETATYQTWQNVRNVANVLLVIAFLFIIFSQLTSLGVTNYGVKKLLPRVILVAIAINLSYIVMQVSIDIVNLLGVGLETIMDTTAVNATTDNVSAEKITESLVTGQVVGGVAATAVTLGVIAAGATSGSLVLLALPFIIVGILGLVAAVATLFLRNALVIVLVILSPIAFAAYLLPNTEQLFTRWRKLFVSMLILFPMATLIFAGGKFAAFIVLESNTPFAGVISLFIMAAPLGALPFLIKSSNSILSGVGNRLQGLAQSAKAPLQKAVKPYAEQLQEQNKAGQRGFFGRQYSERRLERRAELGKKSGAERFNEAKIRTAMKTEEATKTGKQNFEDRALGTGDHEVNPVIVGQNRAGRIARQRNRDAELFDTQATNAAKAKTSSQRVAERQQDRAREGSVAAAQPGGTHNADSRAAAQLADSTLGADRSGKVTQQINTQRIRQGARSETTGERLLEVSQEKYAAENQTKADESTILRIHDESGVADAAKLTVKRQTAGSQAREAELDRDFGDLSLRDADLIQISERRTKADAGKKASDLEADRRNKQNGIATAETMRIKRAEKGAKTVDTEEQAAFDRSIPTDIDLTQLSQRENRAERSIKRSASEYKGDRLTEAQTDAGMINDKLATENADARIARMEGRDAGDLAERVADPTDVLYRLEQERRAEADRKRNAEDETVEDYGDAVSTKGSIIQNIAAGTGPNADVGRVKATARGLSAVNDANKADVTAAVVSGGNTSEEAYQGGIRVDAAGNLYVDSEVPELIEAGLTAMGMGSIPRTATGDVDYAAVQAALAADPVLAANAAATGMVLTIDPTTGTATGAHVQTTNNDVLERAAKRAKIIGPTDDTSHINPGIRDALGRVQGSATTPFGAEAIAAQLIQKKQLTAAGLSELVANIDPATPIDDRAALVQRLNDAADAAGMPHLAKNRLNAAGQLDIGGQKGGVTGLVKDVLQGNAKVTKQMINDPVFRVELATQFATNWDNPATKEAMRVKLASMSQEEVGLITAEIARQPLTPLAKSAAEISAEITSDWGTAREKYA